MTRNEWSTNVFSSIVDVLKEEHDLLANYLFPITSVVFVGMGLLSMYRGDFETAKSNLEVGGGTGGYSLFYKAYEILSQ
jgi:hypothetical protein